MKKLLVLAGGSKRNQAWGEGCAEYFKDRFDITCFIHYDHWATEDVNIDFAAEIAKIAANTQNDEEDAEWFVFAKSIGSILTLKAVAEGVIAPTKCVFFGMPFSVVKDTVFQNDWSLVADFKIPAIAFHNDADPTAQYELTKEKLHELAPRVSLITLSGNTHDYLDWNEYDSYITEFLAADI